MAIFSNKDDIKDALNAAEKHFKPYFEPFAEFERIARNKPHPKVVQAKLPSVTDGTLAAVIQAQPRRVIQQLPTGRVISVTEPELALLADYIWTNQVLPNATTQGDPLQKAWVACTKAKTYGGQWSYQFFKSDGDYYGADFMLPYNKNVFAEPGKLNVNDSEFILMESWWTKTQLQSIIDREKDLKKTADERGEVYKSDWNLTALADLMTELHKKPDDKKSPSEDKDQITGYARIVHAFQRGVGEKFYSYSPKLEKIVRTKVNPDPRGCIPLRYLYDTIDLSNPLGRGAVELSGGMQNLLDSEVQSYQFSRLLGTAPPLKKWGSGIVNSTIKWKPNAVWDMGTDVNAKLDLVDITTDALRNFPQNYGLMKSQILNLTNNQDTSISSESGNPSFSKTQAGVKSQQDRIAIDDNYFRKQFETWWQDIAEDMLNIHFAESSGVREVELTQEFLKQFPPGAQTNYFSVNDDGTAATVMYDDIKTKLKFEVDASTSQVKDDQDQMDRNLQLLELVAANPALAQMVKVDQLVDRIVNKSGVEDPEELIPTDEEKAQAAAQQQAAMQAQQPAPGPAQPPQAAPAGAAPEEAPSPEDEQLLQQFQQAGFTPEQAGAALTMMHHGYTHDEIMQVLSQSQGAAV